MELLDRILAHAGSKGISIEQLQDQSGWELHEFLRSPVQSAAELPIRFFQVLAATSGINWLALVPDET
ncbi:MAG TPA: hypothetical protein VKD04_01065 [Burkholderiales bacterium]|nr:hypothetical protein [Burkholderiales bacterium]